MSFFIASAACCLFLTVALSSAMTTDCYCDGLPGTQCDYCHQDPQLPPADFSASSTMQGQYYQAWAEEHEAFHHQWVDLHREFHEVPRTAEEEAAFHQQMEEAHNRFHGVLSGTLPENH